MSKGPTGKQEIQKAQVEVRNRFWVDLPHFQQLAVEIQKEVLHRDGGLDNVIESIGHHHIRTRLVETER